jgi:hypothetical protein
MIDDAKSKIENQVAAHRATEEEDFARLRSFSMEKRGKLLKAARRN